MQHNITTPQSAVPTGPFTDLTGMTFGFLTVDGFSHESRPYRRFWHCHCICGKKRINAEEYIKSGASCRLCRTIAIRSRTGPRRCPRCKATLDRSSFTRDTSTTDGLCRYCKSCTRSLSAQRASRLRRRTNDDIHIPVEKRCALCELTKPSDDFWRDRGETDGLDSKCSDCRTGDGRKYYQKYRLKILRRSRSARYRMTEAQVDAMLVRQDNQCAVCRIAFTTPRSWCIDHDHGTGKVRGLLCNSCNTAIGLLKDSVSLLRAAIDYIDRV